MNLIKATLQFLLIKQTNSFISESKDRFMPGRSARHGVHDTEDAALSCGLTRAAAVGPLVHCPAS